jgi:hypothetical protein
LANELAARYGLVKVEAQNASNQGIDIFLVDDILNPTQCLLFEVKATKQIPPRWVFSEAYNGNLQMSTGWLNGVRNMLPVGDAKRILTDVLAGNIPFKKLGIFVEGNGTINFLKFN